MVTATANLCRLKRNEASLVLAQTFLSGTPSVRGFMSNLKSELEHIKHHIKYPANKTQVVAACNNMSDVPTADKEFVSKSLPESNFKGPEDVVRALLTKV